MPETAAHCSAHHQTPLGWVLISATPRGLAAVRVLDDPPAEPLHNDNPHIAACRDQLTEYFRGERQSFTVPLDAGGTDWQQRVWDALRAIPYGETRSYGELARELGSPGAARAVGAA